jgi:hypothetical protein
MDYGSLYGMGSYYGQDYTAWTLIRLAGLTEARIAQAQFGKPFDQLPTDQQTAVRNTMREQLRRIDLTQPSVTVPDALANAILALRDDIAKELAKTDLDTGWTPAYSLTPDEMVQTSDFLIYSALTTVARRPDTTWSWTENWPYEPEVGNTPTTNTFIWTWASWRGSHRSPTASAGCASISLSLPWYCCCRSPPAQSWRTPTTIGAASTASRCTTSCLSTSCATCTSNRRSCGSVCRGSAPACSWHPQSRAGVRHADKASWWTCCSGSRS